MIYHLSSLLSLSILFAFLCEARLLIMMRANTVHPKWSGLSLALFLPPCLNQPLFQPATMLRTICSVICAMQYRNVDYVWSWSGPGMLGVGTETKTMSSMKLAQVYMQCT
jgi:hypothetical protein